MGAHRELLVVVLPTLFFALGLRTAPFGVAALAIEDAPKGGRAFVLAASATTLAALVLLWPRPASFWLGIGAVYAYFGAASVIAWSAARLTLRAPFTFLSALAIGLVAPGFLFSGPSRVVAVVLGFELSFKIHSYWIERQAGRATSQLGDALMFLLVNPTLVYADRGVRATESPSWLGVGARLTGAVALLVAHYTLSRLLPSAPIVERSMFGTLTFFVGVLIWLQLIVWYMAHSATASLQIVLMRGLGWKVPERYRYAFLARSPEDFWRRWNTYLGVWFYRYVFLPVGLGVARTRRLGSDATKVLAVMTAFGLCGALHELSTYMDHRTLSGGAFLAFLFGGAVLVFWAAIARSWRRFRNRGTAHVFYGVLERGARILSPVLLIGLVTVLGSVFLPGLTGKRASAEERR
ncbi:MAG TPA: MBOAT family O-acyltransferase [Polyangiaceae bacterium]|nr:MBOAT family O-acyltransferase [Polyangiaceae bacterium]